MFETTEKKIRNWQEGNINFSKMRVKVLVLTTEEANARKLTASIPSDHSWDTKSNWPYS